ncbi:hypothetical protein D3C78_1528600 [compost metagenome]
MEGLAKRLQVMAAAVVQRQTGIKRHPLAAGLAQLGAGVLFGMRFPGYFTVDHADLVGTDNQMVRIGDGQCLGFRRRQP